MVISSTTTNGRTRYWPMLIVQMAKPHALNVLWSVFGGRLGPVSRKGRGPGWAGMLRWEISGTAAQCPLKAMLAHLTVKREQAELLLEMLGREWPASTNGRGICWTPEVSAEWQKAKDRIQELNRRGTAVTDGAIAQRVGDQWMTLRTDLFGERWETFSDRFPASGSMRNGSLFERPTQGPRTTGAGSSSSPLLPTPRTSDTNGAGAHGDGGLDLRTTVSLLPTPRASDGEKGGPNQRGSKGDLALPAAVVQLLPTPNASDFKGSGATQGRTRNGRPRPLSDADLPETVALLSSTGADSAPPSAAGKPSPDDGPPGQLTFEIG